MPGAVLAPSQSPAGCAEDGPEPAPENLHQSGPQQFRPSHLWAQTSVRDRLRILTRARHLLAARTGELTNAISPELARSRADSLVAEVLPFLAACKFLEQQACPLLAPQRPGRKGLPFWLNGLDVLCERVPLGTVLIVAPSNYPLFLPGVQVLQALAAGNAVVWKPGRAGLAVAEVVASAFAQAGLPEGLLRITGESVEAARRAIDDQPALIVFTGSADAGRAVQHLAAERSIPVIAELSGCDAVFVLPGASVERVLDALAFGMRLNGSATCMAPRRLMLIGEGHEPLLAALRERFASIDAVALSPATHTLLNQLLADAIAHGARPSQTSADRTTRPILIEDGSAALLSAQTDIFAPVLTVLRARDVQTALELDRLCPLGLTASIFGPEPAARALARQLSVGSVLINDLIVPTADPRVSFGGRGLSGFGRTRGIEGLLAMTAVRTTSVRTGKSLRHFQPTTPAHESFFESIIQMSHAGSFTQRFAGLRQLIRSASRLR